MALNISKNLINARKNIGVNKSQVCKDLGMPRSNPTRWEKGQVVPSLENISLLAQYYGVTIDDIVYGEIEFVEKLVDDLILPKPVIRKGEAIDIITPGR